MPSPLPPNPPSPPIPSPLQFIQSPPLLTVQDDPSYASRLFTGLVLLILAGLTGVSASRALEGSSGLIHAGLGRLVEYLLERQVPGAGLVALAERAHLSGMLLIGAALLLLGRSRRPQAGPHETITFYRRASPRRAYAFLAGGLALLGLGAWVAARVHPLLASVIELPATTLLGVAMAYCLLPESRPAIAVFVDSRGGLGNRIEVSGGPFNRLGRLVVLHDHLGPVRILEPEWTRLLQFRDLKFEHDEQGKRAPVTIEALGPEAEMSQLQGYLNGDFHRAYTPSALQWAATMRRQFE